MVFDIEENEAVWFDFPGGGRVQLKTATPDDVQRIRKASITHSPFLDQSGKAPRVFNHEVVDEDKASRLLDDCQIVAWEGFEDRNGTPIPCTPENKTALMRMKNPIFRNFVNATLKQLEEAEAAAEDDRLKN